MAKWYGKIGFAETVEVERGVYENQITERSYYGDLVSNHWKRQNSGYVNDDINVRNSISIVADPYAMNHCSTITYVEFMDSRWKVTDVEVAYPRLILNVGGVWNGESAGTSI